WEPAELTMAVEVLARYRRGLCPPADLVALLAGQAPPAEPGLAPPSLTPKEWECGCAVSLGLGNEEIATAFRLGDETAKGHLPDARGKLGLVGEPRQVLGAYFERAVASVAPSFRGREWTKVPAEGGK